MASGDLWAGAEVQLYQLLRRLQQVPGLTASAVILNDGELARRLANEGIATLVLDESLLTTPQIFARFLRHARHLRPHVIHTHRVKENILGGLAAALTPGTRSIRTVHGAEEVDTTARQVVLRSANHLTARWLQRYSVAVSTPLAEILTKQLGAARVAMIKNGVDPAYVQAQARGPTLDLAPGASHIAFVGRMVPVKRIDRFLQVARLLIERRGPTAYRFHFIGDGPLQTQMEALADSMGLAGLCTFHGFMRNPLPWLRQMDALMLTSDHEGTPMVILESLALGVPVIAPAVGGLIDLLNTKGGFLVADQSLDEYVRAIEAAIASRTNETQPRATLPTDYDIDTCARQYVDLYERLSRN